MNYSWSIILILLVSLELALGRPENGDAIEKNDVELPQATESTIFPLEVSTIVSAPLKVPSQVQGDSDVNSLPNQNISEELRKKSTLNPPDEVSKNFSNDHKTSYDGSMSNGQLNQIVPAPGQDLLDPAILPLEEDAKKSISGSNLPGSKSNQDPGSAASVKSPLDVPFEDKFQEVSKPSFSDSPLAYKPLRPSYAGSMSNGVPNQIVPARMDAPQDVPVKEDFKPLVPGAPAIDSAKPPAKSPPFEEKFQEVSKPSFSDSPLAYKPLRPSYAGSMSNGVPNQIVPARVDAPQDVFVKEDFKPSVPEVSAVDSLQPSTKSPLDIPFDKKFEKVSKPSFSDSPLAYKPLRPSFAGSMSNGVPNQIVPARVDAPQDVSVKEDFKPSVPGAPAVDSAQPPAKSPLDIPFDEKFEEVAKPSFSDSPLAYKPLRPSYAGSMSNGVPNQIVPARVDAPQDVPVKEDVKPLVPGAPTVDSAQPSTKSPLDIPFDEKFEEVAKPSFSDSPLAYKSSRPSFAGSMSNGIPNQIVPARVDAPQDVSVKEDFKPSVPGSPAVYSAQPPAKSPLDIPFEDKFQEVSKPSFSDSPLTYKPLRPFYAGSMSNGVPNQIVPARVDAPQDVPVKEDFKPSVPGSPAVDSAQPPTKSPLDIPFDGKFKEVAKPSFSDSPLGYKPLRPSYAGSMSNGVPNQIVPARVDAPQDVSVKEDFKPSVPGAPGIDSAQPPAKSPLDIPFEDKFQEVSKPSFSNSPLGYKPLRPSYAGSMSNGVPNQIVPARVDAPQDVSVKEDFKPSVPGAPAVDSAQPPRKSPLDIPFDEKFEEVAKPSFSDSPLAYKPLRPSYAGSMSNGVPNQIVPARVDAPQDVSVKEDFKPSVPGAPAVDSAQPPTKSPLDIPFDEKFEEVAKPSFSDSPLAYKPLRPSYAGSMSNGVPNQIVPARVDAPQDVPVKEDVKPLVPGAPTVDSAQPSTKSPLDIPFDEKFEEVAKPSFSDSPLAYKPLRPSYAGSMSNGVPNQIVPARVDAPQDVSVKEDFKPSVPGAPAVDSAQPSTKSPLDIPFKDKFQEVSKPSFSDSPLIYKPLRPSYAGSMSNGVPNQIVPARVDAPQDVPVKEDFKPSVPGAPGIDSAQPPTKSPLDIPFEEKFQEVSKPSFSDSPLTYKPLRPSYAGSMSNGVPNQIVPARVDAPQDVLVKEDFKPSVPGTPAQPSTKSSLNIPFEEVFKPSFSDSPLAYKPSRPSYAGSMSSGVLHQIVLLNSDNCSFPNSRINRKTPSKLHRNQFAEYSRDASNRTSNMEESGKPYEIIKERTTFNIENTREFKKFLDPSAGPRSPRKSEEEIDESIPGMKKFRDVLKEVYNSVPIRRYLERRRQVAKKSLQYPGEYSLKHLQPGWYSF